MSRKHPCPDCKMCQGCSESRCRVCRSERKSTGRPKLSISDQIALFDRLNPGLQATCRCRETAHSSKYESD